MDQRLCVPYFTNQGSEWDPDWQLRADAETDHLPKKGVHQLFACAVAYPALWPSIARYA